MPRSVEERTGQADLFPVRSGPQRQGVPAASPVSCGRTGGLETGRPPVAVRRGLLGAAAAIGALLVARPVLAQVGGGVEGPAWSQLSAQQREALAPLAGQWASIPPDSKRKWLEIAAKYPQLSPEGKARVQSRMTDFAKLTPEQRRTARENFQRAYELPRESRESAVQQYQLLPEEKKKQLSERPQGKDAARSAAAKK